MRFLLIGGNGQVGSALRPVLARLGDVVAPSRDDADLERPGELARLITTVAPDIIVNAAAYTAVDKAETEPERARLVNAEAVATLAAAAHRAGIWLVHFSTDYVYDGNKPTAYVETDEAQPLSQYGLSKLRGDQAIAASGCRHLIFRVSWVYAWGHANFPAAMLRLGADRAELNVVADQVGAPTSAGLIAGVTGAAIARITDGPEADGLSGLYHLAAAGEVSRADLARFVLAEAHARGADLVLRPEGIVPISTAGYPAPAARPLNSRLSTDRLRAAFGVALPSWQDDMRQWVSDSLGEGAA